MSPAQIEQNAVDEFACQSTYLTRPLPPLTPEQRAWIYKLDTRYLEPCYRAAGHPYTGATPTEADYVANPGWAPTPGGGEPDGVVAEADRLCPRPADPFGTGPL